jgi:hypothetical protein
VTLSKFPSRSSVADGKRSGINEQPRSAELPSNSTRSPEPGLRTPTIPSGLEYLSPPTPNYKGKQRETFPEPATPEENRRLYRSHTPDLEDRTVVVKDIDLLIERVKSDQADSEVEWRATRPGVDDKAAMV